MNEVITDIIQSMVKNYPRYLDEIFENSSITLLTDIALEISRQKSMGRIDEVVAFHITSDIKTRIQDLQISQNTTYQGTK